MASLPDSQMQSLLQNARKYSSSQNRGASGMNGFGASSVVHQPVRNIPIQLPLHKKEPSPSKMHSRSPPKRSSVGMDHDRRLSEAGVNRRPSAAHILTEDTDSFIIGDRVYVDGIKPGRIQYIGVTKFGPGDDWAGVFLDEPFGKNDGAVGSDRYFTCEPKHGVFSKLHRLTTEPIEGAPEALNQMRRYGYEVLDSCSGRRRDSVGSGGGGRRDSMNLDDDVFSGRKSASPYNRTSLTPEMQRRYSPESHSSGGSGGAGRKSSGPITAGKKESLHVPHHGSYGSSPHLRRGVPPSGKSPLASPRNSRSNLGMDVRIEKDPELTKLTSEAKRLSIGGSARRTSDLADGGKAHSIPIRRPSGPMAGNRSRSGSESESHVGGSRRSTGFCEVHSDRKPSNELTTEELRQRRLSEAGMRKTSETVLNDDTGRLMVGLPVWVDGTKKGRIAFIGDVHFAKGEMAGVHLDQPIGKNNGTVGGIMYFQCEPNRGIFSRLHRLATEPLAH